jgi:hypothetical protein
MTYFGNEDFFSLFIINGAEAGPLVLEEEQTQKMEIKF